MDKFAALFDWVIAGPITLYHLLLRYPIPFIITLVFAFLLAIGFCAELHHDDKPKKIGYIFLFTYLITLIIWFIAHLIWRL